MELRKRSEIICAGRDSAAGDALDVVARTFCGDGEGVVVGWIRVLKRFCWHRRPAFQLSVRD